MKNVIVILLSLVMFYSCDNSNQKKRNEQTSNVEFKTSDEWAPNVTVTSELELFIKIVTEFSRTNDVKWQNSGTDSKTCRLFMNNEIFEVTKVGFKDMLNGKVSYDESYGIPVGVNVIAVNLSEKRTATTKEIGDLMNWNRSKGFHWDANLQCNRLLETYQIENIDLYHFETKKGVSLKKALSEFIKEFSTEDPTIEYVAKGKVGYAYAIVKTKVFIYSENFSSKEIETFVYKGTKDREYTKYSVENEAIIAVIDVPKITSNDGVIISFQKDDIEIRHIGEKL